MLKHDWNACTNLASDISPAGTWPKRKRLGRRWPEGCRKQYHGVDVCIQHDLRRCKVVVRLSHGYNVHTNLVLLASEITQFETPLSTSVAILGCGGLEKA